MTKYSIECYGNNDDVMLSIRRGVVKFVVAKSGGQLAITYFSNQVIHKTVWDDITSRQPARTLVGGGTCRQNEALWNSGSLQQFEKPADSSEAEKVLATVRLALAFLFTPTEH